MCEVNDGRCKATYYFYIGNVDKSSLIAHEPQLLRRLPSDRLHAH